jgi:hypothetical protein
LGGLLAWSFLSVWWGLFYEFGIVVEPGMDCSFERLNYSLEVHLCKMYLLIDYVMVLIGN